MMVEKKIKMLAPQVFVIIASTAIVIGGIFIYSDTVGSTVINLVDQNKDNLSYEIGQ